MDNIDFTIKQNDRAPNLQVIVMTGQMEVVNLTGFTGYELHVWNRRTRASKIDTAANLTVPTPANGTVVYAWQAGDTDTVGIYEFEISMLLPSGELLTIPNDKPGYLLEVTPEIS